MPRPQKVHYFVIGVTFDKPTTKTHALASVKGCIHGEFYPYQPNVKTDPGSFKVKTFKNMPRRQPDTWSM